MSTKRLPEGEPSSSSQKKKKKKKETKFILYKERNGWEKETWYTFIPLGQNKKNLKTLIRATVISNRKSRENDAKRKEQWAEKDKKDAAHYAKYGMPPPKPVHLGATYYELDTKKSYTREEAEKMCSRNKTRYCGHIIYDLEEFKEEPMEQLREWINEEDAESIYEFLYKGGITKLL